MASTRRIFCFNNPHMRGFSLKNVHGTAFLSIDENSNVVFFLDEVVHQCSHNYFNVVTTRIKDYLKIGPNTPLTQLMTIDKKNETRGIYDAFHGLYTVSTGVRTLTKIYQEYDFNPSLKHMLYGRLSIKYIRFRTGIQYVGFQETFTDEGLAIYEFLDSSCFEIIENNPHIFNNTNDFSNQPFVFSYEQFKKLNPNTLVAHEE